MLNCELKYSGPELDDPPIIIPLKSGGSKWKDNELRFSLRSIEKFWIGELPKVTLLTTAEIPWLNLKTVNVIRCEKYHDAFTSAVELSESYIWSNDDIFLLKPTSLSDLLVARKIGKEMEPNTGYSGNMWRKRLADVRDKLHEMGYSPIHNFSSHTPYVFNSKLMKYIILKFGIENKTPLETAYFNIARNWFPIEKCSDKITINNGAAIPDNIMDYRFLNIFDKGLTKEVKSWLKSTFPEKSRFEV